MGKHLFNRCIKAFLDGRVRILVAHQLQYLQQADNIVMLQSGTVVYQGTYGQMEKERQRHSSILSQGKQGTCINDMVTALSEEDTVTTVDPVDKPRERVDLKEEEEDRMVGTVKWRLYWTYFRAALPVVLIVGRRRKSGARGKILCERKTGNNWNSWKGLA